MMLDFCTDKNGYLEVAMRWEDCFNHMVKQYNDIYWVQIPNITPRVCPHTYCSNMVKSSMNPKTLQYLMRHSDIGITLNIYTHLGLEDATDELRRMEDLKNARKEQRRKACIIENVSGDLIYGKFVLPASAGRFLLFLYIKK